MGGRHLAFSVTPARYRGDVAASTLLAEHLGSPRCLGCRRGGALACTPCRDAQPYGAIEVRTPNVDRVVAAWDYDGIARSLILGLKMRGRRTAAVELGLALAERVWERGSAAEALVWIPGRARDIRRRGFDHAHLIATVVSRLIGLPALPALIRAADRMDQTRLGAVARKANLAGAFRSRPVPTHVAIVDDLVTTGATLAEAGRALRGAGADYVEGLVACSVA